MNYTAKKNQVIAFIVRDQDGKCKTVSVEKPERLPIHSPEDAIPHLNSVFANLPIHKEHFVVLALDTRRRVIGSEVISTGTLDTALVHPREVFSYLMGLGGVSAFLVAHNHPSGEPDPSAEDIALTLRVYRAGELMGVHLIDHIVVTAQGPFHSIRASHKIAFS